MNRNSYLIFFLSFLLCFSPDYSSQCAYAKGKGPKSRGSVNKTRPTPRAKARATARPKTTRRTLPKKNTRDKTNTRRKRATNHKKNNVHKKRQNRKQKAEAKQKGKKQKSRRKNTKKKHQSRRTKAKNKVALKSKNNSKKVTSKKIVSRKNNPKNQKRNRVPKDKQITNHIFKASKGHVNPRTNASRQRYMRLFEKIANNRKNLNNNVMTKEGLKNGARGYSKTFRNGKQIWVRARNGVIYSAGVNQAPR